MAARCVESWFGISCRRPTLGSLGSWPGNTDWLYEQLEHKGWTWVDDKDFCPACSEPTKEDIADYKAYHAGEGIHTP